LSQSEKVGGHRYPPGSPGFFKLNFYGTSKGNTRPTGFGAVIRDINGRIIHILEGSLGFASNNSFELCGLIHGIQLASSLGLNQFIMEGDS
jgi:ribonuclease HI